MKRLWPPVLLVALAACDPKVTPTEAAQVAAPGVVSAEGESCAATAECAQGLRCVDLACRPPKSSRVGDYYWQSGKALLADGDVGRAADALQRALAQYETDKLSPPAALLCDAGSALRRIKGDAKPAEQAARYLHRCALGAPQGSLLYHHALAELAELEDQGLDPSLLARDTPADAYLVRPAQKPVSAGLAIDASAGVRDKGYAAFAALLKDKGGAQLLKCFGSTPPPAEIPLSLKYRVTLGDDDLVVGAKLDVTTSATSAAAACMRDVGQTLAGEFTKDLHTSSGSWQGDVTVKLVVQ